LWREVDVAEAVLEPECGELCWVTVEAGAAGQWLCSQRQDAGLGQCAGMSPERVCRRIA
jgi:hypothetical protein